MLTSTCTDALSLHPVSEYLITMFYVCFSVCACVSLWHQYLILMPRILLIYCMSYLLFSTPIKLKFHNITFAKLKAVLLCGFFRT